MTLESGENVWARGLPLTPILAVPNVIAIKVQYVPKSCQVSKLLSANDAASNSYTLCAAIAANVISQSINRHFVIAFIGFFLGSFIIALEGYNGSSFLAAVILRLMLRQLFCAHIDSALLCVPGECDGIACWLA